MKKIFNILTCFMFLAILFSCEKDTEPIVDENGLTSNINAFISTEDLEALIDLGVEINGGAEPPTLNGAYIQSPCVIAKSTAGDVLGTRTSDFYVKLYDQKENTIMVDYVHGTQTGNAIGSFIVGEGCLFSIFVEVDEIYTVTGEEAKLALVISGKQKNDGIEEMQIANLMLDNYGNLNNVWIPNQTGRLFVDTDNFSILTGTAPQWYSRLPDCPCNYENNIDGRKEMCGIWKDCGEASEVYHFGATYEIRWVPDEAGQAGQQCTYDASKRLITSGIAAGSPDKVSPGSCGFWDWLAGLSSNSLGNFLGHKEEDMDTWDQLPCLQYLTTWTPNAGDCNFQNPHSDISHMQKMVGAMNCREITLILAQATESRFIDVKLKNYLLGLAPLNYTDDRELLNSIRVWHAKESCPALSSGFCQAMNKAMDNLEN